MKKGSEGKRKEGREEKKNGDGGQKREQEEGEKTKLTPNPKNPEVLHTCFYLIITKIHVFIIIIFFVKGVSKVHSN